MRRWRPCGLRSSRSRHAQAWRDALGANVTHRIRIRSNPDITLRHRFRDGVAIYRIVAVRVRDRRFHDIDAELRLD